MDIAFNSKSIHPTLTFDKLRLTNMSVLPFNTATLYLQLHFTDESGTIPDEQCVLNKVIVMTTEEYANWTDDNYLIQLILTKLNLNDTPKINEGLKAAINSLKIK